MSITAHLFYLSLPNKCVLTAIELYTIKRVCRTHIVCVLSVVFVCLIVPMFVPISLIFIKVQITHCDS